MKTRHAVLALSLSAFLVVACGKQESSTTNQSTETAPATAQNDRDGSQAYDNTAGNAAHSGSPTGTPETASGAPGATTTPDNTGVNTRDGSGNTPTAADQSNAPADISTTQQIRKAIVADKSLSTNAHNIKIITRDGMVTLRGPVKDTREKTVIEQKAVEIAGQNHVQNELEITG